MDNTEENKYSFGGGVSGDSRISADAIRFSGWQETALAAELPIKFYTTLEQMGLSDADMAEEDFVGNLYKINEAFGNAPMHMRLYTDRGTYPNFYSALFKKLAEDGIDYSQGNQNHIFGITVLIDRVRGVWNAIKIELLLDIVITNNWVSGRERTIITYANKDGNTMLVYPFREVAKVQPVIDITPLNGWSFKSFKVGRVGNSTVFNLATLNGGVRTTGTVIGILPEIYRPVVNCAFTATSNSSTAGLSRIAVLADGQIKVYGLDDSTGEVTCSGSLITK